MNLNKYWFFNYESTSFLNLCCVLNFKLWTLIPWWKGGLNLLGNENIVKNAKSILESMNSEIVRVVTNKGIGLLELAGSWKEKNWGVDWSKRLKGTEEGY